MTIALVLIELSRIEIHAGLEQILFYNGVLIELSRIEIVRGDRSMHLFAGIN